MSIVLHVHDLIVGARGLLAGQVLSRVVTRAKGVGLIFPVLVGVLA
jgi:hypothetical protein